MSRLTEENLKKMNQQTKRSRRTSKDVVMESPRLLPFPYHNDCHFLPTAERAQKRRAPAGSFSDLSLHSQRTTFTPRRAASAPPVYRPKEYSSASSTTTTTSSLEKLESFFLRLLNSIKRKRKPTETTTRRPKESLVWFAEFSVNPPPPNGMVMAAA